MTIQYTGELVYTYEGKLRNDSMSIFTDDHKKAQKVFTAKVKNRMAVDMNSMMYLTLTESSSGKVWKRNIAHFMPNTSNTHWKEVNA